MTLPFSLRRSGVHTAAGGESVFNYGWPVMAAADLIVTRIGFGGCAIVAEIDRELGVSIT